MTPKLIATLPMYDWPQVQASTDRLWQSIRNALLRRDIAAPPVLSREDSLWEYWQSPHLVFGQTCGMPYRTKLHDQVGLVGTPDYGLAGAPAGHYYSVFVARKGEPGDVPDFINRTLAFNGQDSQSGWAAPQNHVAWLGLPPFTHTLHTSAHRLSAAAVASGRADIAAIDAVTWRFIEAFEPEVARKLRVVDHTEPTPGLPYITASNRNAEMIADAVREGIENLDRTDLSKLGLVGLTSIPVAAYLSVPTPPPPSQDAPRAWAK